MKASSYIIRKASWETIKSSTYISQGAPPELEYKGVRCCMRGLYFVTADHISIPGGETLVRVQFVREDREFYIWLQYCYNATTIASWVRSVKLRVTRAIRKFEAGELT